MKKQIPPRQKTFLVVEISPGGHFEQDYDYTLIDKISALDVVQAAYLFAEKALPDWELFVKNLDANSKDPISFASPWNFSEEIVITEEVKESKSLIGNWD